MGKVRICICCAVLCFFPLNLGFSETILLKSGQKVEGRIIEKTDQYVKLDFLGVELVYYKDEISSIAQDVPAGEGAASPQLESLYQAYTSSLKLPQKKNEEKAAGPSILPILPQEAATSQTASEAALGSDLSQLPPEYQKLIKSTLANLQAVKSGLPEEK